MNNILLCFIITSLSSIFTMVGSLLLFIKVKDINKFVSRALILSSIVMLYISFFDLLPASFSYISKIYEFTISIVIMGIFTLFGGILVYILNKNNKNDNELYKLGIISMIALILHNIPEGIITFISTSKNISLGLHLSISIAIHNIIEGTAIAIPIYYGEGNRRKAIKYTLIASLSEPFGAFLSLLFFYNINNYLFSIILSITAGIMIYLSVYEVKVYKQKKMY